VPSEEAAERTHPAPLTLLREKIQDNNPEVSLEALSKYGKDITQLAQEGKLDPVIGRDEELRRLMQILSRRTKNNPVLV